MRVLCVEDETALREDMVEYLRMQSYDVDEAECGEQALDQLGRNQYDLVLCDIKMPRMDGFDVLRQIRGQDHLTGLPFIFLSALSEKDDRMRAHYWGCDGYLTKPVDFSLLDVTLRSHIDRQRARDFIHTSAHDSLRSHVLATIDDSMNGPLTDVAEIIYHLRESMPLLTPSAFDTQLDQLQKHIQRHALVFNTLHSALTLQTLGSDNRNASMRVDQLFTGAVEECRYLYPASQVDFKPVDSATAHYLFGDIPIIRRAISGLLSAIPQTLGGREVLHYDVVDHTSLLTVCDHPVVLADSGEFAIVSDHTDFTLIGPCTRDRLIPLMYALQVARAHGGTLEIKRCDPDMIAVRMTLPNSTAAAWLNRAEI